MSRWGPLESVRVWQDAANTGRSPCWLRNAVECLRQPHDDCGESEQNLSVVQAPVGQVRRLINPQKSMSNRRLRQLARMPIEEQIRRAVVELIGQSGDVYVERAGQGVTDSVLVQVSLREAVSASDAANLQEQLSELCQQMFPRWDKPQCCAVVDHLGCSNYVYP